MLVKQLYHATEPIKLFHKIDKGMKNNSKTIKKNKNKLFKVLLKGTWKLGSARFIDASMYRDTCHAIHIAIQFARIAIPANLQHSSVFYLNVT